MKDKIRITRTLLEKSKDELTEDERAVVLDFEKTRELHDKWLEEENERIAKDCKILCSGDDKMPIPDYGWVRPVKRLCYALENLNYDFKKYGIRVVLDQSKEKYGTLRFYTHLDTKEIGLFGLILRPFDKVVEWLSNINFGRKIVVDRPEYKTVEWKEITKAQFDSRTNEYDVPFNKYEDCSIKTVSSKKEVENPKMLEENVYLVEEDGKFFYSYPLYHMSETHVEYTKHFFLRKIRDSIRWVSIFLDRFYKEPRIQSVKIQEMDYKIDELVDTAERECTKLCQHCGAEFGNYYKECETQGWYMYLCQRCADATGMEYVKEGKHYKEGVQIESDKPDVKEPEEGEE